MEEPEDPSDLFVLLEMMHAERSVIFVDSVIDYLGPRVLEAHR